MEFLHFLSNLRNPVFDFFFSTITYLGGETCFLVIAMFVFWCVSKRRGYYILITGLLGTVINQALKLIFRIRRPWILDESFNAIESAKPDAKGYSFPSGHTQNITGTFGAIGASSKRKPWLIVSIVIIVLVAFSRMYLGVHTPLDVSVSLIIGTALVIGLYPLFKTDERMNSAMPYIIAACAVLSTAYAIYAFTLPEASFPLPEDLENLVNGRKNAATLLGCFLAMPLVYYIDKHFIKFDTRGRWYAQIIKLLIGGACVIGIRLGVKALFGGSDLVTGIRYFLMVAFAGCVYPLSFPLFRKMRIGFLDRFSAWLAGLFISKKKRR